MNGLYGKTSTVILTAIVGVIVVAGVVFYVIHWHPAAAPTATSTPIVVDSTKTTLTPEESKQKAMILQSLEASDTQQTLTATQTDAKAAQVNAVMSAQ